ncbi:MAG TPA: aminotransferase class I/II-fold pyridoxal phosphate-dependent enzyme [Candidatus Limnocylindria bacterium]|nr:aminotransferase class I/II-fold pyridoxal phosphate-dependent enzyme [Candidatus Limnocylindria bacterium]
MRFPEFSMERMQSTFEHVVRYDLSESGVEALTVDEVERSMKELGGLRLGYADGRGREATRALVASFHAGHEPDDVLLTTGTSEANFLALATLVEPGDEVIVVMPSYMQVHGIARGLGARVREVWLREERGWALDTQELRDAISDRTRLVCVCQPNNPTAQRLPRQQVIDIARICASRDVWILADEVYRGAERDGEEAASFSGAAERVIVTGGLSKVYGLPGLRIGWIVGPRDRIMAAWSLKDYTTIAPATVSEHLAEIALERRADLTKRARFLLNERWPLLEAWAVRHARALHWTPPQAGGVCFFSYTWPIASVELSDRLIREWSTMIVPGAHFSAERHVRIGYGMPSRILDAGLAAIDRLLAELRVEA